ncbi:MAG: hypothetical protein ACI39R_06100 [Lachnospiraceae bacterium]
MKLKALLITMLLGAGVLTACGNQENGSGLKVGPTVTPVPEKATEADAKIEFNYSDEEIKEVIEAVMQNFRETGTEYDFETTDTMTEDLTKHDDGSSEIFVYDENDNMLAILMYNKENHLYRAHVNYYENGVQIGGVVYVENQLTDYFETEAGTGKFRVEIECNDEGGYTLSYVTDSGIVYRQYDENYQEITVN